MSNTNDSYRVCGAPTEFNLTFVPPSFTVNSAVEQFHTSTPRFGHSNNINDWIVGDNSAQQDYLTGLLAASFAIFCFFVLWMFLLSLFQCLGPQRVGFCSARRSVPSKPIKPEAVQRQERIRKKHPFQHNGVASGYGDSNTTSKHSTTKKIFQPVVGVAKAPMTVVSRARQRKRELERRNQFSKMTSSQSLEASDDDDDDHRSSDSSDDSKGREEAISRGDDTATANNLSTVQEGDESATGTTPSAAASSAAAAASKPSSEVLTEQDRKIIRQYETDWEQYERAIHSSQDRIRRIRIGAGFCAIGILIAALLFTIMTYQEFTTSIDMFDQGLNQADSLLQQALTTTSNVIERQSMARESTQKFYVEFNEICPNQIEQVCTNVNDEKATSADERGCDFSVLPFGTPLSNLVQVLDTQLLSLLDSVVDVQDDLLDFQDLLERAELMYPQHGTWVYWTASGCSLALGVIALLLTTGIIYIERGKGELPNGAERALPSTFKCCRSWVLIPILLLLVCLSWILSIFFVLMGIGSSDLCYSSPDIPILNTLALKEDEFNTFVYGFLRYYISACPLAQAPQGLEGAVQTVQISVLPAIATLVGSLESIGEANLLQVCGTDIGPYLAILDALGNQLCTYGSTIADLRSLFQCDLWYPMYRMTMHESICSYATQGFTWAAATQIVIVILSLVLLTLRVSYYELDEVVVASGESSQGCCSNCSTSFCTNVGCFGGRKSDNGNQQPTNRRQVAPKNNNNNNRNNKNDNHVGEIKVDRKKLEALEQAKAQKIAESQQQQAAALAAKKDEEAKKNKENGNIVNDDNENDEDDDEESSFESGSSEEESLRG